MIPLNPISFGSAESAVAPRPTASAMSRSACVRWPSVTSVIGAAFTTNARIFTTNSASSTRRGPRWRWYSVRAWSKYGR